MNRKEQHHWWQLVIFLLLLFTLCQGVSCATTDLHIIKYAYDEETIINETTVTYSWMKEHLPVQGDGTTHYYFQGPIFEEAWSDAHPDLPYDNWNPQEDINYLTKDQGAVKGTALRDICDLVGGMEDEDTIKIQSNDGFSKRFGYENVYSPSSRQGEIVIAWYCDGFDEGPVTVEDGYSTGMKLIFFADTSTNPTQDHVFGITDMRECLAPEYVHYYQPGLPASTGLSMKYIRDILIYSQIEPVPQLKVTSQPTGATVFIDGEESDTTNCVIDNLEEGRYQVSVQKEGYHAPESVSVELKNGQETAVEFFLDEASSEFTGKKMELFSETSANGTVSLLKGIGDPATLRPKQSTSFSFNLTPADYNQPEQARLWVYISNADWKIRPTDFDRPDITTSLNGRELQADKTYYDQSGRADQNWSATLAYDVTAVLKQNPEQTVTITNTDTDSGDEEFFVDGTALFIISDEPDTTGSDVNETYTTTSKIFGFEGCDIICANDSTEDPTLYLSTARVPGRLNYAKDSAQVLAVATFSDNADTDENEDNPHSLEINSDLFDEPFDLSQTGVLTAEFDALSSLKSENNEISLAYAETGTENSYLDPRVMLLIVRHSDRPDTETDRTGDDTRTNTTGKITGESVSEKENRTDSYTTPVLQNQTSGQTVADTHNEDAGIFDSFIALIMSLFGADPDENIPLPSDETTTLPREDAGTLTETEPEEMPAGYDITLRSDPPGALIYLDGVYTGKTTPETLSFQDGNAHHLRLIHEGYTDYQTELSPTGNTSLFAGMNAVNPKTYEKTHIDCADAQSVSPNTGSLYIRNAVEGAEVLIDSKETSRVTPTLITGLREGWHTVKLKGYDSSTLSSSKFWVFPETVTEVYLKSEDSGVSAGKSLYVNSSVYENDYLSLNGDFLHKKIPVEVSAAVAGDLLSIRTENNSYISKPVTGTDMSSGKAWFDEYTGRFHDVALVSVPAGAQIFIDGFETGYATPYTIHNLSSGTHIISISKEGYYPSEGEIRLLEESEGKNTGIVRTTLTEYPCGSLYVTSTVPGQKIYLYNRYTGEKTPHLFTGLDLGNYPVKIVSDTTNQQFEITINPYETTYLNVTGA